MAARDKPLSVAMVDIDHFKAVNDTHGHAAGDEVLRELAARLRRFTRSSDLTARLGGEEFVVVMPDTALAVANLVAGRVGRQLAEAPVATGFVDGGLPLTVSIGVAAIEGDADSCEVLLKRADDALYEAKREGRNRVVTAAG